MCSVLWFLCSWIRGNRMPSSPLALSRAGKLLKLSSLLCSSQGPKGLPWRGRDYSWIQFQYFISLKLQLHACRCFPRYFSHHSAKMRQSGSFFFLLKTCAGLYQQLAPSLSGFICRFFDWMTLRGWKASGTVTAFLLPFGTINLGYREAGVFQRLPPPGCW